MDVALVDSIFRHRPVDLGYTIVRHMLTISLTSRSLPYGYFITRILQYFRVSINETSLKPSKSIADEMVCGLGFEWQNEKLMKFQQNKPTLLAPSDDRLLNAVVPTGQLSDFSLSLGSQHRCQAPPTAASDTGASASAAPPTEPHEPVEVTLQQLMDEVRTLFVQQTSFQQHMLQENQRLSQ